MLRWIFLAIAIIALAATYLYFQSASSTNAFRPDYSYQELEVSFESSDGTDLAGTLTFPMELRGHLRPAVLLVPGSGPVDRDESAVGLPLNVFRQLAHYLAKHGIPVCGTTSAAWGRAEEVLHMFACLILLPMRAQRFSS